MFQDILVIEGLHDSLHRIRTSVPAYQWLGFAQSCRQRLIAARVQPDPVLIHQSVYGCISDLLNTDANPIVRDILRQAEERAHLVELDKPVFVSFERQPRRNQFVRLRLDRHHPPEPDTALGAFGILVADLSDPWSKFADTIWNVASEEQHGGSPLSDHAAPAVVAEKALAGIAETIRTSSGLLAEDRVVPPDEPGGEPGIGAARSLDDQHVNVWVDERSDAPDEPLLVGQTYTACFNVGANRWDSILPKEQSRIPLGDIPEEGLKTTWIVSSRTVKLSSHPEESAVVISESSDPASGATLWIARFSMLIPRIGETPIRRLKVEPLTSKNARLSILLLTGSQADTEPHEIYRDLLVELNIAAPQPYGKHARNPGFREMETLAHTYARHLGLRPQHEWQTPPETLTVNFEPPRATPFGTSNGKAVGDAETWNPVLNVIEPNIQEARKALDALRGQYQTVFNDVDDDPATFIQRLQSYQPKAHWLPDLASADPSHVKAWQQIATSAELHKLAVIGNTLYRELFPNDGDLQYYVDGLRPGAQLNLLWMMHKSPEARQVPWSLLYAATPPGAGKPVDPLAFLGMRFRIAFFLHALQGQSKALGPRNKATLAYALYWGQADDTAKETTLHRKALTSVGGLFIPEQSQNAKAKLLEYLRTPSPSPVALIYFYCQCRAGTGVAPRLRFGSTPLPENEVEETELPRDVLADQPIVFVNACDTVGSHAYTANMLEQVFSYRKCRAFIGTECKVPIKFASRFAVAFLYFLCHADQNGRSTSAGEAFVQARRFFWDQYRNVGGLFYSYVNQYELFMGTDEEVSKLRTVQIWGN